SLRRVSSPARSSVSIFLAPPSAEIYTLSLHDALPICVAAGLAQRVGLLDQAPLGVIRLADFAPHRRSRLAGIDQDTEGRTRLGRSEEHTSELQSRENLVCRLLLEKKKRILTAAMSIAA